jgi:hypothetical protein
VRLSAFFRLYSRRIPAAFTPDSRHAAGNGNGAAVAVTILYYWTVDPIIWTVAYPWRFRLRSCGKYSFLSLYWYFSRQGMENQGKVMVNCAL